MWNKIFKSKKVLAALQFFSLFIFILLIFGALGIETGDSNFAKILRNTNMSNLIVWSYWWPMIIVISIFFGRIWCSICPMELITSFFGKIGLKKKPGKFIESAWVVTIFYTIILVFGIHTFSIHRIPHFMAIYMIILFVLAVVVGLIWEKRTFCTSFCPIGHLLGLYSLIAFKKIGIKSSEVCKLCKTKDCVSKSSYYNFTARSCTSNLYPPAIADNRSCILCGQCFKSCKKQNVVFENRKFAWDLFQKIQFSWAEITFFLILSGFVVYEILSSWKVSKTILLSVPDFINQSLHIAGIWSGTIKAFTLFMVFPALFYFLFVLLKTIAKENIKTSLNQLVLAILPIVASMHILKTLLKTTSRIPYWNFAIVDPIGIDSANEIMSNPSLLEHSFLTTGILPVVDIIALVLPFLGLVFSLLVINKQQHKNIFSRIISVGAAILYSSIYIVTLFAWKIL